VHPYLTRSQSHNEKYSFFRLSMHFRENEPTVAKKQSWIWNC